MSVGKKGPYHLYLNDGDSTPTTEVGLILDLDEEGQPRVSEGRVELLPPRQSEGPISWTSTDPMVDMVWAMEDWSDGGLRPYYKDGDKRYAISDNVDARWPGVLALGMREDLAYSMFVANSSWEGGGAGDWTLAAGGAGNVAAVNTTLPRSGRYALQLGANDVVNPDPLASLILLSGARKNALTGRSVTFGVWTRPTSSNGGDVRIAFWDGAGSEQSGTQTSVGAVGSWTFLTHTATITTITNDLRLRITNVPPASLGLTVYVDDMVLRISGTDTAVGVVEAGGSYYTAIGPFILVLNTDTANQPYWQTAYVEPAGNVATSIVSYRDKVYVGYGTSGRYIVGRHITGINAATTIAYNENSPSDDTITDSGNGFVTAGFAANDVITVSGSTSNDGVYVVKTVAAGTLTLRRVGTYVIALDEIAGDSTVITAWGQVRAGDNADAFYFAKVGDKLWKNNTTIALQHLEEAADPALPPSTWVGETVTDEGSPITNLYELNGGIVVGTERGLVAKLRFEPEFQPIYTPFETSPDAENFARGAKKDEWLYLTTAKQGLVRFNGAHVEDLSNLFISPRHTNFGGRVRAVAADPAQVWCLMDTPALDTSLTKTTRLVSLMEVGGELSVHPMTDVDIADVNALAVAGTHLYAFGRLSFSVAGTYYMRAVRWWLPLKSAAPYQDEIGGRWLESSGYIDLPVWTGGLPDTQKALYKATAWVANTSASNYITVTFGVDGNDPDDNNLGGTGGDGRLDAGASIETLEASTQASTPRLTNVGRSFAVRLTFTRAAQTDPDSSRAGGGQESPKLYAIAFHFRLAQDVVRRWEMFVRVGGRLRNGQDDPQGVAAILAALNTLEAQAYPIELEEDFDQDDSSSTAVVVIRQVERVFETPEQRKPGVVGALYRLVLQEVT